MYLLCPCYDLSVVPAVVAAAKKRTPVLAIVNPWSGPGSLLPLAERNRWRKAVAQLQEAGARVLYYIDVVQWPGDGPDGGRVKAARLKTEEEIQGEAGLYRSLYPAVNNGKGLQGGWFLDDTTPLALGTVKPLVKALRKDGLVMVNPGASQSVIPGADWQVDWETTNYSGKDGKAVRKHTPPQITTVKGKPAGIQARSVVMALGVTEWDGVKVALRQAAAARVAAVYVTDREDDWNPHKASEWTAYDALPGYFEKLAKAVRSPGLL